MHSSSPLASTKMQAIYSSFVLVFVVLVTTVKTATVSSSSSSNDIITSTCAYATYPSICQSSCKAAGARKGTPKSKKDVFDLSIQSAVSQARYAHGMASNITRSLHLKLPTSNATAMDDCLELLDISIEQLSDVVLFNPSSGDVDTWLSAAITNQQTCMDSLQEGGGVSPKYSSAVKNEMQTLSKYICNSLSLYKNVKGGKPGKNRKEDKKNPEDSSRFPAWMTVRDRRLLESSAGDVEADAVVAMDGTGTHSSISAALAFVSLASTGGRSVIYVKSGVYKENINIPKKQKNVMLMGDGKGKSVIVGSRNVADGYTTYNSATVAAMGPGFIAKGLTIINNSGPQKEQAVALRVGADLSVVYQCSIQGYQDTLYSHSNRQFYRDNDIYGTVDFIFGNAAAVYQNCLIQPRKPGSGQRNSITAQGRLDPNQNTGFSFHKCSVVGSSDLGSTPTYLGRPWHQYSRTVFMESTLGACVNSEGWERWSGNFALNTLYYGEYGNTGPGAGVGGRVKWGGVHPSMSVSEASKFTVGEFIVGDSWLPSTGVAFISGL